MEDMIYHIKEQLQKKWKMVCYIRLYQLQGKTTKRKENKNKIHPIQKMKENN